MGIWVAVKGLISSYYMGETIRITMYTHYGNLIQVPLTAIQYMYTSVFVDCVYPRT